MVTICDLYNLCHDPRCLLGIIHEPECCGLQAWIEWWGVLLCADCASSTMEASTLAVIGGCDRRNL